MRCISDQFGKLILPFVAGMHLLCRPGQYYSSGSELLEQLSGGRNLPLRRVGGTTASMASSFSLGSARTYTCVVHRRRTKASELAAQYDVRHTYSYEQYPELLKSGEIDGGVHCDPELASCRIRVARFRRRDSSFTRKAHGD